MEKIIVHGGHRLEGTVEIEGAKNAVLPILAASILASEGRTFLSNVPILSDVYTMSNVIRFLNVQVGLDESPKTMDRCWHVWGMQKLQCRADVQSAQDRSICILKV